MKRCLTLILALIAALILALTAPALADSYFIYNQYGGTWQDANKTYQDDSLMCWAATASNILAYGGWGTSHYNTGPTIFQEIVAHWTNNSGYMSWAWNWWFNGSDPPNYFVSYPDVPGGGNYYPTLNFSNYFTGVSSISGNIMAAIDLALHQGKGVGMIVGSGSNSHAVTVWGYSYDAPRYYTRIFITDSDDGFYGLREYPLIYQNSAWYLGGSYAGWKINAIQALGYYPTSSTSNPVIPLAGDTAVPLAPSWILFGTGVSSLFLLRRRRQVGNPVSSDS